MFKIAEVVIYCFVSIRYIAYGVMHNTSDTIFYLFNKNRINNNNNFCKLENKSKKSKKNMKIFYNIEKLFYKLLTAKNVEIKMANKSQHHRQMANKSMGLSNLK